jgi:hypothetical protein
MSLLRRQEVELSCGDVVGCNALHCIAQQRGFWFGLVCRVAAETSCGFRMKSNLLVSIVVLLVWVRDVLGHLVSLRPPE